MGFLLGFLIWVCGYFWLSDLDFWVVGNGFGGCFLNGWWWWFWWLFFSSQSGILGGGWWFVQLCLHLVGFEN